MANQTKVKTVGFQTSEDFPLTGKELKQVIESLRVFILAVNEPEKYNGWVASNKIIAGNLDKLLQWSVKQDVIADKKESAEE